MIIAEIYVPSVDKTYEFKLNEDVAVSVVIDEITAVICQKEQCSVRGDKFGFLLFSSDSGKILSLNLSLYENGIRSGSGLMLV